MADEVFDRVRYLVPRGDYLISEHGREELAADDIATEEIVSGTPNAELIESYPEAWKGPSMLVLQRDRSGRPIHVVWGLPREQADVAVLVTAYRPDESRWMDDFKRRRE